MKKIFGRLFFFFLSLCMIIFCTTSSFAAVAASDGSESSPNSLNGIWGGEATAKGDSSGTFNVYVPKYILRAGMTLKTECSNPNSQGAVDFMVYDPNGRLVTNDEILGHTDEDNTLKIWNAPAGNYKVEYYIQGVTGTVHMYCWIYG